ncbi:MAG TPA: LuxR C-terminal-related transcriptional regulator, partial [Thermomicrobiales bacterium]|nr:LuxR C-terminal-related transcriptional regulator [Thermomicrobiales bacterium]
LAVTQRDRVGRADLERLRALELYREIPGLSDTWFAYHPLFRDVLRRELARTMDAAAIARLHHGVAGWFAREGMTLDAALHLLAAGDAPGAAVLIESRLADAFACEDWRSIASWLRSIPFDELRRRPELLLGSAWVSYLSGRESQVTEVQAALRDPAVRDRATEAQRAEIALIADPADADPRAWLAKTEAAIALLAADKRYQRGYAEMMAGLALTSLGREDEALARLAAFTDRESARIDAASIRGYFGRALVLWQAGRLARCEQIAADLLQLSQMNELSISAGWGAALLGHVAHERGDLAAAARHFETVIAGAERFHFECVRESFFAQMLTYEARGMRGEADRALARLRELCLETETAHHLDLVDSFVARLALLRGDLAMARRWLDTSRPIPLRDDLKVIAHPVLTRIKILIAVGAPDALREADRLLAEFVQFARAQHMRLALLESLAVQALRHEANGERTAADGVLRESLTLAAPEGVVQRYAYLGPALAPVLRRSIAGGAEATHARNVLRVLETVLAARGSSPPSSDDPPHLPANPLTERELQVLRRLALRLTNNEIGHELFISPLTVKHHVEHISEKLGVSGRRAIVAHAAALGLLPDDR